MEVGEGVAHLDPEVAPRAGDRRRAAGSAARRREGSASMPPSRPSRRARLDEDRAPPSRTASQAMPWRRGFAAFAAGAAAPRRAGAATGAGAASGQMPQAGRLGRADRGAEVHQRLRPVARAAAGVSAAARPRARGFAAGSGSSTAKSRAITRSTLPSTTLVGRSKAIAATAAAV